MNSLQLIADYQAKMPFDLIKKVHRIAGREISDLLHLHQIPLRGKGGRKGKGVWSDYWEGFIIRPCPKEAERSREVALKLIRIEEFNPIATL